MPTELNFIHVVVSEILGYVKGVDISIKSISLMGVRGMLNVSYECRGF